MRPEKQLDEFREALTDCSLMDLGYVGAPFTWSNRREGEGFICECLDRFVGNGNWCSMCPSQKVSHGIIAYSDHISILLNTKGRTYPRQKRKKPFYFEESWRANNSFRQPELVMEQIRECGRRLRPWNHIDFGHVQTKI